MDSRICHRHPGHRPPRAFRCAPARPGRDRRPQAWSRTPWARVRQALPRMRARLHWQSAHRSTATAQPAYGLVRSATARVAAAKNRARSTADAASNCSWNRSSSAARSLPPSPAWRTAATGTIASDTSSRVRARARGKPGESATGAKYDRAPRHATRRKARAPPPPAHRAAASATGDRARAAARRDEPRAASG